jgi:hypothetical protein
MLFLSLQMDQRMATDEAACQATPEARSKATQSILNMPLDDPPSLPTLLSDLVVGKGGSLAGFGPSSTYTATAPRPEDDILDKLAAEPVETVWCSLSFKLVPVYAVVA